MTKDLANVRIYGDEAGAVFVSLPGQAASLPTDLSAVGPSLSEIGWTSEDGVSLGREDDVATFRAWQGGNVVRKKVTSSDHTFTFQALEETATVLGLYYSGAPISTVGGLSKIEVSTSAPASDRRAWVIDFVDGGVQKRLVVPDGEVTEREEIPHQASEMTVYGFTVTIYGDYDILTNSPGVSQNTSVDWDLEVKGAPSGGTYILSVDGLDTGTIAYDANATAIQTALRQIAGMAATTVTGMSAVKSITFPKAVYLTVDDGALTGGSNPEVELTKA